MPRWEYSKIDLNNAPVRGSEIDLLDDAGRDGWELVRITDNNLAYLKRVLPGIGREAPPRASQVVGRKTAAPQSG
jgi:hypothetical protein